MNDEELMQRLRRLDPVDRESIDPVNGPRAAARLEQTMNTPLPPSTITHAATPRRRWPKFALAGGTAAALAVGGVFAFGGSGGGSATRKTATYVMEESSGPVAGMCINLDEYQPSAGMAGFKGTVTALGDGTVTLKVTHWFAGGDADVVTLMAPANTLSPMLEGSIEFQVGSDYLVAVLDGQVLARCGISGIDDPALEAYFQKWFAA